MGVWVNSSDTDIHVHMYTGAEQFSKWMADGRSQCLTAGVRVYRQVRGEG